MTFTGCHLAPLFLAPLLAGTVLLGVFRAAAIGSSPRHDRDRSTEKSSPAAGGLIRSQSLSFSSISDKQGDRHCPGSSNVSLQD